MNLTLNPHLSRTKPERCGTQVLLNSFRFGLAATRPAVMHFVFLVRDEHFEARFHTRLHGFRVCPEELDLLRHD